MVEKLNIKLPKKDKWLTVRLTAGEFAQVKANFRQTGYSSIADYLRNLIFSRPISVVTRNQSLDALMEELIRLRADLNAVGNNFNQVVRKINGMRDGNIGSEWFVIAADLQRQLLKKIDGIQLKINEYSDKWL